MRKAENEERAKALLNRGSTTSSETDKRVWLDAYARIKVSDLSSSTRMELELVAQVLQRTLNNRKEA